MLTAELIREAHRFLNGKVRHTPLEESPALGRKLGVPVYLKLENWQITGSFKVRGALFAMAKRQEEGLEEVATCSAGNHGKGIAWAAKELGMEATIFVPKSVDTVKVEAMERMGAKVETSAFGGYDDTERWALAEAEKRGLSFISAYDDDHIMAANGGSIAIEVLEDAPAVTNFVMPLGGGGHAGGFSFHMKSVQPQSRITVCQHRESPGFLRSVEAGQAVTELPGVETLASGLEGGFGVRTFDVLKSRYDEIRLAGEEELKEAMRWMARHHQMIIEGSSAVAVAACLQDDFPKPSGPLVVFISGRNIGAEKYSVVLRG